MISDRYHVDAPERAGEETETETYKPETEKDKRASAPRIINCPNNVREETWADWLQLRKAKRAPVTQTAIDQIEREAVKAGWTLEQALAESTARGWTGFKAEWLQQHHAAPAARNNRPAVYGAGLAIFGNLEAEHEQHQRIIDITPALAGSLDRPDF